MDNRNSSCQAIYNPGIFEVKNVDEAKSIILTPEKGIKTDDESLFTEHDESDMKKEKKSEEIFYVPFWREF